MILKQIQSLKNIHGRLGTGLVLALAVLLLSGLVYANGIEETLEWNNGRITVKGDQLSVSTLLERISESAGIKIFLMGPPEAEECSLELRDASVEDALRSILRDQSYAVFYTNGASQSGIKVFGGSPNSVSPHYRNPASYGASIASRVSHATALRSGVEDSIQKHIRKMAQSESEKAENVTKTSKKNIEEGPEKTDDETL